MSHASKPQIPEFQMVALSLPPPQLPAFSKNFQLF